ncbi:MAG: GNAT family N-acetyltransferase [Prevotellaceae bacterium]|jgi:predicted acetyltransferase|nr:GNAT family N-acetyltransferase [Prevotellaceae bacterium]
MQITFGNKSAVRQMWKTCFDDSEAFLDLYFGEKYEDKNTLIGYENDRAVASLQMLPYRFRFCGVDIPIAYISGACTLPEFRNRGYMGELLAASFEVMAQRNIPLSILVPAETWLFDYYARFGYEQVFFADNAEIPLRKIIDKANGDVDTAYQEFNRLFNGKDFSIQKSKADFRTIIKDAELDDFSPRNNLSGMVRVIDGDYLKSLYKNKYPEKSFDFQDIRLLCRSFFEGQKAVLNLMLE